MTTTSIKVRKCDKWQRKWDKKLCCILYTSSVKQIYKLTYRLRCAGYVTISCKLFSSTKICIWQFLAKHRSLSGLIVFEQSSY